MFSITYHGLQVQILALFFTQSLSEDEVPKIIKEIISTAPKNQEIFKVTEVRRPVSRRKYQNSTAGIIILIVGSNRLPNSTTRSSKNGMVFIKRNIPRYKRMEIKNHVLVPRQNTSLLG